MNTNQNLSKGVTTSSNFIGSRAYTFVDSYIYMKNKNHNALYDKNKEILMIENEAIKNNSPKLLYNAFFEQMRILDSLVDNMRNFSIRIREDVMSNISMIMPSNELLDSFDDALKRVTLVPRFKYVEYNIGKTNYIDMIKFFTVFKNELKEYCTINNNTSNLNTPTLRNYATDYLKEILTSFGTYSDNMLNMENVGIANVKKLLNISIFFKKKSQLIQMITEDFRTYNRYLKQYKVLYNMTLLLKPTIVNNEIMLDLNGSNFKISFNDYLIMYKHFSSMVKSLLDIVNLYNNKFFNKIYAVQSNIETYRSIMRDVVEYVNNEEVDTVSESTNSFNELHGLINGNSQTMDLLNDDVEPPVEYEEDEILQES